ncbi:LD-carboxypeptidase, partial [Bacillus sp. D-CC]
MTHRTKTRPVKVGNLTIGGNNELIIQSIDYDAFQNNPKIMIGYSDATALLL